MDFSKINKYSRQSFLSQQTVIKKLAKGQAVYCDVCHLPLSLCVPSKNTNKNIDKQPIYGIFCPKKCTYIELEFDD